MRSIEFPGRWAGCYRRWRRRRPGACAPLRSPIPIVRSIPLTALVMLAMGWGCSAGKESAGGLPSIADKTRGMTEHPGYFDFYWDAAEGKIWLAIAEWDVEFLYHVSLPAGMGSNDIGLDRSSPGGLRVVRFTRGGNKVLLVESNTGYRASSGDPAERRSVKEAFAESVLGGFTVAAEDDGRALIDATGLLLQDVFGVAERLEKEGQGTYEVVAEKSAVFLASCKSFPDNTELEVTLTLAGKPEGDEVRAVTPDPRAVTVRQRHSLIRAPDRGYRPRAFDPRSGYFPAVTYHDYSAPIGAPLVRRLIARHRLEKKDPTAALGEPVAPIVYYVDRGVPEPIRSALIDGASWWSDAFEAAGFKDAFRVELLPDGADPMDVRYNVIQWVHRRTRGWSYGWALSDPRTGEIIKGHVLLGSLRVRQDYLIAEGLLAPYETGAASSPIVEQLALARLRQLAAHEVGHTLGLAHNFAASVDNRASVMDYPPPVVTVDAVDRLDTSGAYGVGVGAWDAQAIRYGYQTFAPDEESTALAELLAASELHYISDADARAPGSAHPQAHLWDNGRDPVAELERVVDVRARALAQFGERVVPDGAPMATLEETLVPVYFGHRYQIEAVVRLLGGLAYTYNVRGDGRPGPRIVPAETQRTALGAVVASLAPSSLALPERILALIPPRPVGYERSRETLPARTGPALDPVAAAESLADGIVALVLDAQRAARLVEHHARRPASPGLDEVVDRLVDVGWRRSAASPYEREIQRAVGRRVLHHLMLLVQNGETAGQVRAIAHHAVENLAAWLVRESKRAGRDPGRRAHLRYHLAEIERFVRDPASVIWPPAPSMPQGAPIGAACASGL